jgi:hypothetical protein
MKSHKLLKTVGACRNSILSCFLPFLANMSFFFKPDLEISGGSEKKTGQTVIVAVDYEKIRGD